MKVMTMSIGEIEFNDTFFDPAHYEPFVIVSFILLVLFFAIITISMMNILIGVTVGDMEKLSNRAKQLAFKSKVEIISNNIFLFRMAKQVHKKKLNEIHNLKIDNIDASSDKQNLEENLSKAMAAFSNKLEKSYRKYTTKTDDTDTLLTKMIYNQFDQKTMLRKVEKIITKLSKIITSKIKRSTEESQQEPRRLNVTSPFPASEEIAPGTITNQSILESFNRKLEQTFHDESSKNSRNIHSLEASMNMRLDEMNRKIGEMEKLYKKMGEMQGQIVEELKSLRTHRETSYK